MLPKPLFFFAFSILSLYSFAQDENLLKQLNTAREDTNKVHLFWDVAASIVFQDPVKGVYYFKQGTALAEKLNFEKGLEKCNAGTSTAFAYNAQYDSALHYINKAIYYAKRTGDVNRLALVYLNRADAFYRLSDFSSALRNCDTAMNYAESSGNPDRLARIYNIYSDIYSEQLKYDQSMHYIKKASALYQQTSNPQMTAQSFFNMASLFRQTGKLDSGIIYLERAIEIAESIRDIRNLSSYYGDMAVLMLEKKKFGEAAAWATKAMNYAKVTQNTRQESVIHSIFYHLYDKTGKTEQAIISAKAAYNILKESGDLDRERSITAYLAEAYKKLGNTNEAYHYLKISKELNDSLMKQRFDKETARLQSGFEFSQKEKEIELLNKDRQIKEQQLSRQRVIMIASIALGVLSITAIMLLIGRYRLKQRIREVQLRNQIAADLHDEVGSSLSSIHMLSQIAVTQQESAHKEILGRVSNYSRETMEKMGDIVWMIKSAENEDQSLREKIERLLYEECNSRQIQCSFEWEGPELSRLDMKQRRNIYLIFKEALNNALKYSGAKKIDVKLRTESRMVKLMLMDDGKGFDPGLTKGGNGLGNMKKRAEEMNGTFQLHSSPGEGTKVEVKIKI